MKDILVCIVKNYPDVYSETFIKSQENLLGFNTVSLYGNLATQGDKFYFSYYDRILCKIENIILNKNTNYNVYRSYKNAFRILKPDVVVAQFGTVGIRVAKACQKMNIPLIVYFRGYDAYIYKILNDFDHEYKLLFQQANYIIAVSHDIRNKLIKMGAEPSKVIYQPSGVDCKTFKPVDAGQNTPQFLAVGRLVDKKAPHLTLLAFYNALKKRPDLRLRMVGTGPLLGVCYNLVSSLGIKESVDLLGQQSQEKVIEEMRNSRAFLQHSIKALDGDQEGTPNSVMEASASALPVISTRHAGIKDIVIENKTGFLVDEMDINAMEKYILLLSDNPMLASEMGKSGRNHVCENFSRYTSHETLLNLILKSIS